MPELQQFAGNLWIMDGPNVRDMGFMFTTRMTVVKLSDGSLWVNSPVPLPPDALNRVVQLGPVRYLVAATPRHVWRLAAWHALFPDAQLWAARRTQLTLQKGDSPFTGILTNDPPAAWRDDLDQLPFEGNPLIEEVLFFHKQSRTLILDDLIQIHPLITGHIFRNALFRLAGVASPHGGVPLDIRLVFTHRKRARQSLEKLLSWDFDKLIIAHGPCIPNDAKVFVMRAFHWLNR
jgi:hypothetical protein